MDNKVFVTIDARCNHKKSKVNSRAIAEVVSRWSVKEDARVRL